MAKNKKLFSQKKSNASIKLCVGLLFFLIILIAICYVVGLFYYKNRFVNGTYINGKNYSGYTANEVISDMNLASNSYSLTIYTKENLSETIKGKDFELKSIAIQEIYDIFDEQDHGAWIKAFISSDKNYEVSDEYTYNTDKLNNIVESLSCVKNGTIESQNATIDKNQDGYYIREEQIGNIVNKEKLLETIKSAISSGNESINLLTSNCYKLPTVTKDAPSLQDSLNKIKKVEEVIVTIDFNYTSEVLDKSKILNWVTFDLDGNMTLNKENISMYVSQLAYKYDTYKTDRQFTTNSGTVITVGGGIYGYQIEQEKLTDSIYNAIINLSSETIIPPYNSNIPHFSVRQENDIGNTYLEVSIQSQHLWYYKNGEVIFETDLVSGLPNGERDTPTGVFGIWSREHPAVLGTYAVQGYECPVEYWMPIDWTGVGLHDYKRSAYGGTIYKTNGSHGCLNLPLTSAKYIYENATVGTPVVIY